MIKILLSFLISAITISASCAATVRNIQDNHQIVYTVINTTGAHVGGQVITVKIEKVSNSYWYDFSDSSFKTSGWTTKNTSLTEDATEGMYYYTFNPPASESAAEQYVFLIENTNTSYADHQVELVSYQLIGSGSAITTADLTNITGSLYNATMTDYNVSGSMGNKFNILPTSGTGDWNATEKASILSAAGLSSSISNSTNGTKDGGDWNGIEKMIRVHQ